MPPVRRNTAPVAVPSSKPVAPPPADLPEVDDEVSTTGWSKVGPARRQPTGDTLTETASSAEAAAAGLAPKLEPIAAAPMVKALGDGTAALDVPLKAGTYKLKGVSFTVKPGTVAHVNVQVKNGELVSVGKGQKGTGVKIDPPLDLPLWVTGQGVELKGDDAKQKFDVELGGFFDLHFKAQKLSDMLAGNGGASGATGAMGDLAAQLIDPANVKVDAKVTLREATLDVGGAKVKVDPSTTFSVKGDGQHTTLSGHVQLDGFALNQGGVQLNSHGGGKAALSATMDRVAGGYQVDSRLTGAQLSVDSLTSSQASTVVPGKVDTLSLGPTEVHDGSIHLTSKLGVKGLTTTGMTKPTVELSFKGSGTVNDAQLTVKDAKDSAHLAVSGHFDGAVGLGPQGLTFDANVKGAHVDVRDLQESVQGNHVSIEHAVADGDLHVTNSPGKLLIDGQARNIDLVVDDFKGGAKGVKADLGRTSVTGGGSFHVGSDGVDVEGRLHGSATIDAATFTNGKTKAALGSSTVSGDVTKLDLRGGAANLRVENVAADLGVKRASLEVGQASVQGGGRVKGSGTVVLDGDGFSLDGKAQVSMQLDTGKVHSSSVDLSLTKGSGAELNINELSLGKTSKVTLGPGSHLDAVLAGGSVKVGDNTVELEKGGKAKFSVTSAQVKNGKSDLVGSLELDARVKGSKVGLPKSTSDGLTVHPSDVEGRVKVSVKDAHLSDDRLSFASGKVSLDATVGHYTGAKVVGQPGFGTMQDPVPAATADVVKKSTAAQLAGAVAPPPATGSPVEALKLIREGQVRLEVPLQGSISELGIDLVKMPPGSRLELALSVHDGKIVAKDSKATLSGGVKAVGVEVLGVHLDDKLKVHADLKVAGRTFSVPVPGARMPADMEKLAALAATKANSSSKSGALPTFLDLGHAQLDVANATVSKGRIVLPGGSLEVTDGAKVSFHGTPLAGELTGTVGFDQVSLNEGNLALKGSGGRADLRVAYHREGNKAVVEGGLSNMSMNSDYMVRKWDDGDYIALGAGRLTGGSVSMRTEVPVDAAGMPLLDGSAQFSTAMSVSNFTGELKGTRIATRKGYTVAVGPTQMNGAVSYSKDKGLAMKGTLDTINGELTNLHLGEKGREMNLERARLRGTGGTVEFGADRMAFDARSLAWDVTARQIDSPAVAPTGPQPLKHGQVHISGEGHFAYDSLGEVRLDGRLKVEGAGSADVDFAKKVTVKRGKGVSVTK